MTTMTRKTVLSTAVLVTTISVLSVAHQQLPCGAYEEWRNCSSCEGNCTDPNPPCTKECKLPMCQCIDGYVRYRRRCINETRCPMEEGFGSASGTPDCGTNEQYDTCHGCEGYCDWWRNRVCTLECRVGCQCKPGYVRHSNGSCVHFWECPQRWRFRWPWWTPSDGPEDSEEPSDNGREGDGERGSGRIVHDPAEDAD